MLQSRATNLTKALSRWVAWLQWPPPVVCDPVLTHRLSSLQSISQQRSCSVQLGTRSAGRHVCHLGNFIVTIPFDIVQHKDDTSSFRQLLDRAFEIENCLSLRIINRSIVIIQRGKPRSPCLCLPLIRQKRVDGDPMKPGRDGTLSAVVRQRLPGRYIGVLGQFGRTIFVTRHPQAYSVHPIHGLAIERLERGRVPTAGSFGKVPCDVRCVPGVHRSRHKALWSVRSNLRCTELVEKFKADIGGARGFAVRGRG
jgi:hypothetical protein